MDTLGSSISVTTEDVLVDEFQHAIATIEAWESIKITDRNGNEVFSILNADSE